MILLFLAAALVFFYCYVTLRGPRDFAGELATLLPPRTSGFAALNDFEAIRTQLGRTRLYDELSNSIDLAALLMTSEQWRDYQENKDSVESKAKAALAREFLRRYFSREVVVALTRLDRCDEPALLIMARTDLGFAEKLGELCAQLYPELHLVSEDYRGIPLVAYEAPQSKRSFTYVRFGKTVVLSLLSNERDYLKRVIDYRLDAPRETLFHAADFQGAMRSPARRRGLLLVARPTALLKDLFARPEFDLRDHLRRPTIKRIQSALAAFRFLEAHLTAGERLELRCVAHPEPTSVSLTNLAPPAKALTLLDTVPANCLGFAALRFDNLAAILARILYINRAFGKETSEKELLAEAIDSLNTALGVDVNRDLAPAFGHETVLVVHNVQLPMLVVASLLFPVADRPRAESAVQRITRHSAALDPAATSRPAIPPSFQQVPAFHPLFSTPLGFLGVGWLGRYCVLGLSPESYLAMQLLLEKSGPPITRQAVFQSLQLPLGEPLDAVAFIDLEELGRRAEGVLGVLSLASKSVRARSAKYGKIVAVVKLLRGAGLYARHTRDEWTLVLRIPTQ